MEELRKMFDDHLESEGLVMSKQISSGGVFSNSTFDRRTVFSREEMHELNRIGFFVDESMGAFIFNVIEIGTRTK